MQLNVLNDLAEAMKALDGKKREPCRRRFLNTRLPTQQRELFKPHKGQQAQTPRSWCRETFQLHSDHSLQVHRMKISPSTHLARLPPQLEFRFCFFKRCLKESVVKCCANENLCFESDRHSFGLHFWVTAKQPAAFRALASCVVLSFQNANVEQIWVWREFKAGAKINVETTELSLHTAGRPWGHQEVLQHCCLSRKAPTQPLNTFFVLGASVVAKVPK